MNEVKVINVPKNVKFIDMGLLCVMKFFVNEIKIFFKC